VAAPEPHDHAQINDPYFATLQILTDKHDLRCEITVRGRRRSIGTTVLVNLLASPASSLKAGEACVLYAPSGHQPCPILRSIEQGWEGSYIKHTHRSNGLADELHRTIGPSAVEMNHVYLKEPSVNRPR